MADTKISVDPAVTNTTSTDVLPIVTNVGTSPANSRISISDFRKEIHVGDYGALGDGSTDDLAAIDLAIAAAAVAGSGSTQGAVVRFDRGAYMVSGPVVVPNRVTLRGSSARGTRIDAAAGFTGGDYVVQFINGTSAMFDTGLIDIGIRASNLASLGGVQHNAFQENSVFRNVLIDRFTTIGLDIDNGYGGAAWGVIENIISAGENGATAALQVRAAINNTFRLIINGGTFLANDVGDTITNGILMEGSRLIGNSLLFERVTNGVHLENDSRVTLTQPSGHSATASIVTLNSNWTGRALIQEPSLNGATQLVDDNTTGGFGDITNINEDSISLPYMLTLTDDAVNPSVDRGAPMYLLEYTSAGVNLNSFTGIRDGQRFTILVGESDNGTILNFSTGTIRRIGGTGNYTCEPRALIHCYHIGGVSRTQCQVVDP